MVCSNVSPESARRHRPRGGRFPPAWRARGQARPARRLRGAALGPPHQRLPRRLGGGAARRSCRRRPGARQLRLLRAQERPEAAARYPRQAHFPGAARRRALAQHGHPVLERTFPLFPGQGEMPLLEFVEAVLGHRLRRRIFARDIQRPVPRRLAALDCRRRSAFAGLSDGPIARQTGAAKLEIPAMPPRSQCLGVEFIEFAADDHTADELARFISGLGFQQSGDSTNRRR